MGAGGTDDQGAGLPEEQAGNRDRALTGVALRYGAGFAAGWLALNLGFFHLETRGREPDPAGTLLQKMRHFAEHRDEDDVVFVGDSRTYCAMHPDLLDPVLETRSINLARWAHWFPTQYPQFEELVPLVGDDTVVVWSIGHQNFRGTDQEKHLRGLDQVDASDRARQVEPDDGVGVVEQRSEVHELGAFAAAERAADHPLTLRLEPEP